MLQKLLEGSLIFLPVTYAYIYLNTLGSITHGTFSCNFQNANLINFTQSTDSKQASLT